jgi:hypothetical protein
VNVTQATGQPLARLDIVALAHGLPGLRYIGSASAMISGLVTEADELLNEWDAAIKVYTAKANAEDGDFAYAGISEGAPQCAHAGKMFLTQMRAIVRSNRSAKRRPSTCSCQSSGKIMGKQDPEWEEYRDVSYS